MRRISLALALFGAMAAAGCGGGTKPAANGGAQGVAGSTFTVKVRVQGTGTVTSTPAGINCSLPTPATGVAPAGCSADFAYGTTVTLAQTTAQYFNGFYAGCSGTTCELTGNADKYVVAYFSANAAVHPNFNDPAVHGPEYLAFYKAPTTYALNCTECHGSSLQGAGLAVSCSLCHGDVPLPGEGPLPAGTAIGGHFEASGHNDVGACARCHAGAGFQDYIGADGTADNHEAGYTVATGVTKAAALEATTAVAGKFKNGFDCYTCHNAKTVLEGGSLSTIRFPSFTGEGTTVTVDKVTAICGQCHSTVRDDRNIASVGAKVATATDPDLVLATGNSAVRPHYLGAAVTFLGEETGVYGKYPGAVYTARNEHGGLNKCTACHNAHTGELPKDGEIAAKCGGCHNNEANLPVTSFMELEEVRQYGFEGDIDGDGIANEPLKDEITGLLAKLDNALNVYGEKVGGAKMCQRIESSGLVDQPYILVDANVACGTAPNNVAYNKFTKRSLIAAFNYAAVRNDPGAWAHNPRYAIEIIYDSIADLNQGLVVKTFAPVANGKRAFIGHFGAIEDPSPYAAMLYHGGTQAGMTDLLPPMGFTGADCYQCHGGKDGLAAYLTAMPAVLTAPAINDANKVTALQCSTCHVNDQVDMKGIRSDIGTVYFPPQKAGGNAQVSFAAANLPKSFPLCGTCHSGRENAQTVTTKIGVKVAGDFSISSTNPHYLGAAGMMLGDNAKMMYQYAGKSYTANPAFWATGTAGNAPGPHGSPHGADCTGCHQPKASKHEFGVDFTYCGSCHAGQYALAPIEEEYHVATAELFTAMQSYVTTNLTAVQAAVVAGYAATGTAQQKADAAAMTNICFNGAAYPYWYVYTTTCSTTGFSKFDSKLYAASFNYMWTQKEPGAWAHNEFYVFQAMYDSIVDLGQTPTFTVKAKTLPYPSTLCDPASPLNRGCVAVP